jgi:hypothetical protein
MFDKKWLLAVGILIILFSFFFYYKPPQIPEKPREKKSEVTENVSTSTQSPTTPIISTTPSPEGQIGESSGGESGEKTASTSETPSNYTPKVNYTLSIESLPSGLKVFTSYFINGEKNNITSEAPYSVQVDENSVACTVAAYLSGSGVVKWEIDGEECQFSDCEGYSSGCKVLMDKSHTITLYYTPVGE